MLFAILALQTVAAQPADPFAFFTPSVVISRDDRRVLDAGGSIAHVISGTESEVAVCAAVPVHVDGERLVAWIRRIEDLKKSSYVVAIHRFSKPPRIEDLAGLTLDDKEASDIARCRPGDCGLKLSASEIETLHSVGEHSTHELQQRFREMVLARVNAYLASGEVAPYENSERPIWPIREFVRLVDRSPFLDEHLPHLAAYLRRGPAGGPPLDAESFLYWSKERIANAPIVSVSDVTVLRGHDPIVPDVLVAGKEIFTTRYVNASLGLTALVRGGAGQPNYLVYVNRTSVDMLGGTFGRIIRWFVERRVKSEAGEVLQGLKRRLESGWP